VVCLIKKHQMQYSNYSSEDFVTNEYFIRWVKSPDDETNAFWNSWISQHPNKKNELYKAREIVLLLDIKENKVREGKFLETWEKISGRIEEKAGQASINIAYDEEVSPTRKIHWYYKIAAVLLVGVLAFWGYTTYNNAQTVLIQTAYGESRTLFLPDSTKVTLNANSSIRYSKKDLQEHKREVWLDGEAFFSVVHKSTNENFKVHTNELEVEVLGTRFDVNSRRGMTKVILEEGKVKLDMNRSQVHDPLVMKPGDFVEVSKKSNSVKRKSVDPDEYLSWRNNMLEFNSTSLKEIANLIEDNYGYQVVFRDQQLAERKFTGSSSSDDLQELTQKLSKLFDLKITQEGNVITIDRQ
jgi:transmembrane sensor